jgi:Flp pilus assembly pilin Flp
MAAMLGFIAKLLGGNRKAQPLDRGFRRRLRPPSRLWHDNRGVAGIEFAIVVGSLCLIMMNAVDVAHYIFTRMQVENAAQMGAQAAWKSCDPVKLPAVKACTGLAKAITAAVQSTSLSNGVQLQPGSPSEGYFCLESSGALKPVGSLTSRPVNCSMTGMPNLQPGDYIAVSVTFAYRPLFDDLTVARFFTTPITQTAHMRLL